jgi:FdrA protein
LRRLEQEALDAQVALILLDVVLGFGAHPDPAGELAQAIAQARSVAQKAGRFLEVVAIVVGTDEDPQDLHAQMHQLVQAGAHVETSNDAAVRYAGRLLQALAPTTAPADSEAPDPVDLSMLTKPLAALNVGLESFTASLEAQDAPALQVDWRPPAGGNERLMALLEKMRG